MKNTVHTLRLVCGSAPKHAPFYFYFLEKKKGAAGRLTTVQHVCVYNIAHDYVAYVYMHAFGRRRVLPKSNMKKSSGVMCADMLGYIFLGRKVRK